MSSKRLMKARKPENGRGSDPAGRTKTPGGSETGDHISPVTRRKVRRVTRAGLPKGETASGTRETGCTIPGDDNVSKTGTGEAGKKPPARIRGKLSPCPGQGKPPGDHNPRG